MQISVQQGLGVVHKTEAELRDLGMQRLVGIEKGSDKSLIPFGKDITALVVVIRLCQNQIFGDFAEFRIRIEPNPPLFLFRIQDQIRGGQKGVRQKGRDLFAQMRIEAPRHQLPAEIVTGRHILHGGGGHGFVIIIDLGDQPGGKLAFQLQDGGFDLVAVEVQRTAGGTEQTIRLLDNHGTAVTQGSDLKDIVDVAVADFAAFGLLVRVKAVKHLHGIAPDIVRIHEKEGIEGTHEILLSGWKQPKHRQNNPTHLKLYTTNRQKSTLNQRNRQKSDRKKNDLTFCRSIYIIGLRKTCREIDK